MVSRYQYTVDRLGLRTAVTETLTTQTRITSTYDGLNRLIGAHETPGTTYVYAYDRADKRTASYYYNETSPGEGGSARLRLSETTVLVRRGEAVPHQNGNRRGGLRPPHPRRDKVSL